jgi:hypothetical protein
MATGTAGSGAREYPYQMIHYLRKSITYADNGTTVTIGTIPAGSVLVKPISGVSVSVAFNGGSTNTLDIGPSTDTGTNLWMTVGALGSIAFVPLDEAVTNLVSVDTIVQAAVVSTAGASAGNGEIIIAYIPDNDA